MDQHVTFLLRIPKHLSPEHITSTLSHIWQDTDPVELTLGNFYVSRLHRVTHKEIYAIGIQVISDSLNELRDRCSDALGYDLLIECCKSFCATYILLTVVIDIAQSYHDLRDE